MWHVKVIWLYDLSPLPFENSNELQGSLTFVKFLKFAFGKTSNVCQIFSGCDKISKPSFLPSFSYLELSKRSLLFQACLLRFFAYRFLTMNSAMFWFVLETFFLKNQIFFHFKCENKSALILVNNNRRWLRGGEREKEKLTMLILMRRRSSQKQDWNWVQG